MQIRKHGERIQLLRAHYVPQAKRSVQTMIASLPAKCERLEDVPQTIRKQLAPEELEQLRSWFEMRELQTQRGNDAFPLPKVPSLLEGLTVFIDYASEVILRADVDEISQRDIQKLNRALHRLLATFDLRGHALQYIRLLEPIQDHNILERELRYLTQLLREDLTKLDEADRSLHDDLVGKHVGRILKLLGQQISPSPRG